MLALATSKAKFVSLTFDDGPSIYTNQILAILDDYHIKATFFVVGEAIIKYPDIIKQIKAENHVIGNHTWNHPSIIVNPRRVIRSNITNQLSNKKYPR